MSEIDDTFAAAEEKRSILEETRLRERLSLSEAEFEIFKQTRDYPVINYGASVNAAATISLTSADSINSSACAAFVEHKHIAEIRVESFLTQLLF